MPSDKLPNSTLQSHWRDLVLSTTTIYTTQSHGCVCTLGIWYGTEVNGWRSHSWCWEWRRIQFLGSITEWWEGGEERKEEEKGRMSLRSSCNEVWNEPSNLVSITDWLWEKANLEGKVSFGAFQKNMRVTGRSMWQLPTGTALRASSCNVSGWLMSPGSRARCWWRRQPGG